MQLVFYLIASTLAQGVWENIGESGNVCIHAFLLPNNRIMCVERPHESPYTENPKTGGLLSSEMDLQGGAGPDDKWTATMRPIPILNNPFCSGHASMADGSIIVVGGDNKSISAVGDKNIINGRQGIRVYKPCPYGSDPTCIGQWDIKPDMSSERWYPTVVTLGDGRQIIFGGQKKNLEFGDLKLEYDNPTYEYYPPKEGKWPRDLELLSWAYPHNLYPQSFLLPSGKVFLLASNRSLILDPATEKITNLDDMPNTNHSPWIYPHTPVMVVKPMTIANTFQFELMICGGSEAPPIGQADVADTPASKQCMSIRPDDPKPTWKKEEDMPTPRLMPDSVILPDGKLLMMHGLNFGVAGGNQGQVLYARDPNLSVHLYDPAAPEKSRWSSVSNHIEKRLYHSGALLLETGHVISVGSEMNNYDDYWPKEARKADCFPNSDKPACTDPFNYQISRYTPDYLKNVKSTGRPLINFAPRTTTHGSLIEVSVDSTAKINRLTFIRMATTTHSTNTDQRFVELKVAYKTTTSFFVRIPASTGVAPPGNWFLFALRDDGVPSIAKTINLLNGVPSEVDVPKDATKVNGAAGLSVSLLSIVLLMVLIN